MTDTSPAAELRAAAERIRTLAVDADDARPAPWAPGAAGSVISKGATGADYVTGYTTPSGTAVAAYIAAMGPGVGAVLADWLVATAHPDWHDHLAPHALAVARQINGSQR